MSSSPTEILRLEALSKRFGGITALNELSLEVRRGEILGIVGPNGAGKSAMINVVTGFYQADGGKVLYGGRDITRLPAHQRGRIGIARTFQNIRLFKRMTVLENVMLARKQHVMRPLRSLLAWGARGRDVAEAMAHLESMRLAGKADRLAGTLAYGEARRLEIARALAGQPELLFLDEPAAGMNDQETEHLIADIRATRARVQAIVIVEHDVALLRDLSDRLVAIDYGQKIAQGTPDEVLSHPQVVSAYLGAADAV